MSGIDSVKVTTEVAVDPFTAFEVFTAEIGDWWGDKMRPGTGPYRRPSVMRFEPGAGGRLLEVFEDAGREPFVVGEVRVWERGARLVFEWRQGNFAPDESTEVEVRFEPAGDGTRVTLEHRGWRALPLDHSTRHGLGDGEAFARLIAQMWEDQLGAIRDHAEEKRADRDA